MKLNFRCFEHSVNALRFDSIFKTIIFSYQSLILGARLGKHFILFDTNKGLTSTCDFMAVFHVNLG